MAVEPDWDMTPYFPEFDGSQYREFRASLIADVANLLGEVRSAAPLSDQTSSAWAALLARLEEIASRSEEFPSIDPERNVLQQLDRLSKDRIRELGRLLLSRRGLPDRD